ncbi:MAG TPA: tRNA (N(6)-L-threonylcarbamoyladenosine(37)-C(2))-methylthiotransferase MtaB [Candidatus Acidoferrales bacterium]|jgi:threonylcarbamoyladenosine tRNA methylthiotransferase MtaB|nr:tRNA (N(6)-L-threonylcarbamoyladenosine(37)-C(2))-methylthiotransferase MtaB [Candidatus Acidoferrales bacterium]
MTTFYIEQFGCRATQADAAAIERQLLERGFVASCGASGADVVVVNTCTVTAAADLQARQSIRTIHRENPAARVIVTGCYAQRAPEELAVLDGVTWVVGNSHKPEIPHLIEALQQEPRAGLPSVQLDGFVPLSTLVEETFLHDRLPAQILIGDIQEQQTLLVAPVDGGEAGHTRPVLKIQDGCNKRCSYCVIPEVRGRSRSLDPQTVVNEISKLCVGGAREVVLSGIDLGNYGRDLTPRVELGELLKVILDRTVVERLRASSVEPMDVTEDLIRIFADEERMARHFHMPMQSGSDRVLKAMHRWYRAEHYARRAQLVRKLLPDAAIGADVIAGFPGETEADHRATLSLVQQLPLTYLHVFSFSARPGTAAAGMQNQVPEQTIARRARELRALGEKKKAAFHLAQTGSTIRALTLHRSGENAFGPWTRALSSNYLDVRVSGEWDANRFLDVRITGAGNGHLNGTALLG